MGEYFAFTPFFLFSLTAFWEVYQGKIQYSAEGISAISFLGRQQEQQWVELVGVKYSEFWRQHVLYFKGGEKIRVSKFMNGVPELLSTIRPRGAR